MPPNSSEDITDPEDGKLSHARLQAEIGEELRMKGDISSIATTDEVSFGRT